MNHSDGAFNGPDFELIRRAAAAADAAAAAVATAAAVVGGLRRQSPDGRPATGPLSADPPPVSATSTGQPTAGRLFAGQRSVGRRLGGPRGGSGAAHRRSRRRAPSPAVRRWLTRRCRYAS